MKTLGLVILVAALVFSGLIAVQPYWAAYSFVESLRDNPDVDDPVIGRQLSALGDAGVWELRRAFSDADKRFQRRMIWASSYLEKPLSYEIVPDLYLIYRKETDLETRIALAQIIARTFRTGEPCSIFLREADSMKEVDRAAIKKLAWDILKEDDERSSFVERRRSR